MEPMWGLPAVLLPRGSIPRWQPGALRPGGPWLCVPPSQAVCSCHLGWLMTLPVSADRTRSMSPPLPPAAPLDRCRRVGGVGRRVVLLLLAAVGGVLLGAALGAVRSTGGPDDAPRIPSPVPAGEVALVRARLPEARPVPAVVGDVVVLAVPSRARDVARLAAIGVSAPVGPDLPGELRFVADRPGRFDVTLAGGGGRIGSLAVAPRDAP